MPSKNSSQSGGASRGRGASATDADGGGTTDRRKGRSRSPSGYIRKSGKSVKGFLGGGSKKKKKKSSRKVKSGDSSNSASVAGATSNASQPQSSLRSSATTPGDGGVGGDAKPSSSKSVASSVPAGASSFEEETVYDVVVDDSSTLPGGSTGNRANGGSAPSSPARPGAAASAPAPISEEPLPTSAAPQAAFGTGAPTIQLILLLMELNSRRFELLQLEFDPHKALSSDILSQVPVAATEESLRMQRYAGICNVRGKEMRGDTQLLDFVEGVGDEDGGGGRGRGGGGGVAIAIPEGISGKECAKLAAPILNDPKVKMMLDQTLEAVAQHAASVRRQQEMESLLRKQAQNNQDSAANATSRGAAPAIASSMRGGSARDGNIGGSGGAAAAAAARGTTDGGAGGATTATRGKSGGVGGGGPPSAVRMVWMAVVAAALVPILVKVQEQVTAPLSPGDEFRPGMGRLKSKCGFLTLLPRRLTDCHDRWVTLSGDGSVLTCYDVGNIWTAPFEKAVAWRLSSPAAGNGQQPSSSALKVLVKGKVTMAGKKKTTLEYYTAKGSSSQVPPLTPWPFEVDPKVSNRKRVKKG